MTYSIWLYYNHKPGWVSTVMVSINLFNCVQSTIVEHVLEDLIWEFLETQKF